MENKVYQSVNFFRNSIGLLKLVFFLMILVFGLQKTLSSADLFESPELMRKIGYQIWQNECGQKVEGLTTWNKGEEFASLGIGHFIWYPTNYKGPFKETFPDLLDFMKTHKIILPHWLENIEGCPWQSKEEFTQAFYETKMSELRQFLVETIDMQIIFMTNRLKQTLLHFSHQAPNENNKLLVQQFERLIATPAGLYTLLDYLNFKGEGLANQESYQGFGWGLKQVLERMPGNTSNPVQEFVEGAQFVLKRRVAFAPLERDEQRWLKGWYNRLETYRCWK